MEYVRLFISRPHNVLILFLIENNLQICITFSHQRLMVNVNKENLTSLISGYTSLLNRWVLDVVVLKSKRKWGQTNMKAKRLKSGIDNH